MKYSVMDLLFLTFHTHKLHKTLVAIKDIVFGTTCNIYIYIYIYIYILHIRNANFKCVRSNIYE